MRGRQNEDLTSTQIRFDDGQAYERYMGKWSRLAGEAFLEWLAPKPGGRWLDVGCGNGAFTELIFERAAPAAVKGIDPSEAQLSYARGRLSGKPAEFARADAMALPFPDDAFDAAVMPLVIFFVPVPAKGVAEMARVVASGGLVAAYAWDMPGGGFPYAIVKEEMRALDGRGPRGRGDAVVDRGATMSLGTSTIPARADGEKKGGQGPGAHPRKCIPRSPNLRDSALWPKPKNSPTRPSST